jgi:hypothetical protein
MFSHRVSDLLTRQITLAQRSLEWFTTRHQMLTSSDVASALNCNIHESSLELLKRKCAPIACLDLSTNKSMRWGETYEPVAKEIYKQIINKPGDVPDRAYINTPINTPVNTPINTPVNTPINTQVNTPINTQSNTPVDTQANTPINTEANTPINTQPNTQTINNLIETQDIEVHDCGLFKHINHKWLGASPDGIVSYNNMVLKLLEIKCPYHRLIIDGYIPYYYWIQVQIQMEVADVDETDFFQCCFETSDVPLTYKYNGQLADGSYWGLKKYTLNSIKRDRVWFNTVIYRLSDFWQQVEHYREFGLSKLMADTGNKQVYYNVANSQLEVLNRSPRFGSIQSTVLASTTSSTPISTSPIRIPIQQPIDIIPTIELDRSISVPRMEPRQNNVEELDNTPTETLDKMIVDTPINTTVNTTVDTTVDTTSNTTVNTTVSTFDDISTSTDDDVPLIQLIERKDTIPISTSLIDWNEWVNATATRNHVMNDPLLDWLNEYGKGVKPCKTGNPIYDAKIQEYEEDAKSATPFYHYIQAKGIAFEESVVAQLYQLFPHNIMTIANPYQARQQDKVQETTRAMKAGVPIIYQGVLHNESTKTYGIADLIVRSDYLSKIFTESPISKKHAKIPCKFSKKWHYRVIDIKHATLALRADGTHLLNAGSIPAYKSQILIYNDAVGLIQEYTPPEAYILGRKWSYTKNGERHTGSEWFEKAGVIDYQDIDDEYKKKTSAAVEWVKSVRTTGHKWSISPPSRKELYPNMTNDNDHPWRATKEAMSQNIGEITSVWMCGVKNRDIAMKKGITSWKDPRCTAHALGINGPKIAPIVDGILNINRRNVNIKPKFIKNKLPAYKVEFFVDFETVNDLVSSNSSDGLDSTTTSQTYLFMIGVGYRVNHTKPLSNTGTSKTNTVALNLPSEWKYKHFTTPFIDPESSCEKENFLEFHDFLLSIIEENSAQKNYVIYHWSQAERTIYDTIASKYHDDMEDYSGMLDFAWCDLLHVFKDEPIFIKGAFNYSLKSIAKAMFNLGMIQTNWLVDGIVDGLNAMVKAVECSQDAKRKNIESMVELPLMKKIIEYNEIDCKVMMEILYYLRNNHIDYNKASKKRTAQDTTSTQPNKRRRT